MIILSRFFVLIISSCLKCTRIRAILLITSQFGFFFPLMCHLSPIFVLSVSLLCAIEREKFSRFCDRDAAPQLPFSSKWRKAFVLSTCFEIDANDSISKRYCALHLK